MQRTVLTLSALALTAGAALTAAPAHAAASVSVDADGKGAVIDRTYSTTLTVSGKGFQSVKGGHGGVYVWFGTVNGDWKPSQGGQSGVNYVYVPDEETKDNGGFQRYVAFPGSNTADAANGGTMNAQGNWSTELVVPGPKFQAVGRNGGTTTVDCTKVTCGVITIGAHGVRNGNNETFTPVKLADLGQSDASDTPSAPSTPSAGTTTTPDAATDPADETESKSNGKGKKAATPVAAPSLSVDHVSATAGRALAFNGQGLVPGEQFSVVLDDGLAAVGPFAAGADGRVAGVIQLPADLAAGTHELRVFGASVDAKVSFGTQGATAETAAEGTSETFTPANVFAAVAGALFVAAVGLTGFRLLRSRRAQA